MLSQEKHFFIVLNSMIIVIDTQKNTQKNGDSRLRLTAMDIHFHKISILIYAEDTTVTYRPIWSLGKYGQDYGYHGLFKIFYGIVINVTRQLNFYVR